MASANLPLRQWFQDGEGIAREVISADIQRYLGPDAHVKPGEQDGKKGYVITAFKMLTTNQVQDLKADSEKWLNEQNSGHRDYSGSQTYQQRQYAGYTGSAEQSYQQQQSFQYPPSTPSDGSGYTYQTPQPYTTQQQQQLPPQQYQAAQPRTPQTYQYAQQPGNAAHAAHAAAHYAHYGYPANASAQPATHYPQQPATSTYPSYYQTAAYQQQQQQQQQQPPQQQSQQQAQQHQAYAQQYYQQQQAYANQYPPRPDGRGSRR